MVCEKCKNKKPTVFFTDGGGANHSLCAACATLQGESTFEYLDDSAPELLFSPRSALCVRSLFSPMLSSAPTSDQVCGTCKRRYGDIASSGEFGCPECAGLLCAPECNPKMPRRISLADKRRRELNELRERLDGCVKREDYEAAAELRDRIRELENAI